MNVKNVFTSMVLATCAFKYRLFVCATFSALHPACRKLQWWGTCMVICLERDADLHMAQLMALPLTVSCFSKIQIGFTILVPAHPGSPGKRAVKRVCVCVCVCVCACSWYWRKCWDMSSMLRYTRLSR